MKFGTRKKYLNITYNSFNFKLGAYCLKLLPGEKLRLFEPEFSAYGRFNGKFVLTGIFGFYQSFFSGKKFYAMGPRFHGSDRGRYLFCDFDDACFAYLLLHFTCNRGHTLQNFHGWPWTCVCVCVWLCVYVWVLSNHGLPPTPRPKSIMWLFFYTHAYAICYRLTILWQSWITGRPWLHSDFSDVSMVEGAYKRTHTHTHTVL